MSFKPRQSYKEDKIVRIAAIRLCNDGEIDERTEGHGLTEIAS